MIEEERLSEDAELLVEPAEDGPHPDDRIDDERHDEENRLKPEYVRAVLDALEAGDKSAVYDLVEPLHPADIADLLELTDRSEEHTSELQSLMRISYAVFCLKKKKKNTTM